MNYCVLDILTDYLTQYNNFVCICRLRLLSSENKSTIDMNPFFGRKKKQL